MDWLKKAFSLPKKQEIDLKISLFFVEKSQKNVEKLKFLWKTPA
ncbi:tmRNA [Xenococcus sp. PCC 7305]|nr:hypothetical protein [Xenococcus sp. PCC 7305]ELS05011.1 tmRNA [Xenococcus sp. PCC 7305]